MEPSIVRGLNDKIYEKRRTAALDLEKLVRECYSQNDVARIVQIIDQLVELFGTPSNALHSRIGGLIGLAATAIALGVEISPFMDRFIEPLLRCFSDTESRIRYFACESMYNIAKVSKGEILVYFNPLFDSLSKLAADPELSVKNGAELLDRLLKDIVAESAPIYFPQYPETERIRQQAQDQGVYGLGIMVRSEDAESSEGPAKTAFSLAHFMPLLSERIYAISPFTRSYLVSWITVLDSVPDLELVSFLPEFLDGLLYFPNSKYLSDPTEDVHVATKNLMADFLREIRDIAVFAHRSEEKARINGEIKSLEPKEPKRHDDRLPGVTVVLPEPGAFITDYDGTPGHEPMRQTRSIHEDRDNGSWTRGQGVSVDHAAIVEILIQQLDASHDETQQSTALRWLAEFLDLAQGVMVPFTPRLIPTILPNLAHHVVSIQSAAQQTNQNLFEVIQNLPPPQSPAQTIVTPSASSTRTFPTSPLPPSALETPTTIRASVREAPLADIMSLSDAMRIATDTDRTPTGGRKSRASTISGEAGGDVALTDAARPQSPSPAGTVGSGAVSNLASLWQSQPQISSPVGAQPPQPPPLQSQLVEPTAAIAVPEEPDPFDYQATVTGLTIQFLSEYEETRVAALKWLIMLHTKAPRKILAIDDGTFPALLKTLSDPSEEVIKHDLQLLAQISSSSEEGYFKAFMMNLLELFSTDRRLLETRGSLIIRQLCLSLNTERIYRTFAEILEKEEDLDFASIMVQRLNVILVTSPELSDFRKRLKNLESRDGQALFSVLYRSWCHNPVAVFSLCLLAQAYEHASNLLPIVAELEITVQLLVQIDKLVQLIESPVFTSLRLQLLEPEKYPYLFKCLYGLLMLLPQSSAFISLRNRLNAVSSLGFLHAAPRPAPTQPPTIRSKLGGREETIKWQDLLSHFRALQTKHEKARRGDISSSPTSYVNTTSPSATNNPTSNVGGQTIRPNMRRKVTDGSASVGQGAPSTSRSSPSATVGGALSPLNPKARTVSSTTIVPTNGTLSGAAGTGGPARPMSPLLGPNKQRKALGVTPRR